MKISVIRRAFIMVSAIVFQQRAPFSTRQTRSMARCAGIEQFSFRSAEAGGTGEQEAQEAKRFGQLLLRAGKRRELPEHVSQERPADGAKVVVSTYYWAGSKGALGLA